MENLRVRRAGYCNRQPYSVFLDRYKVRRDGFGLILFSGFTFLSFRCCPRRLGPIGTKILRVWIMISGFEDNDIGFLKISSQPHLPIIPLSYIRRRPQDYRQAEPAQRRGLWQDQDLYQGAEDAREAGAGARKHHPSAGGQNSGFLPRRPGTPSRPQDPRRLQDHWFL